MSSPVLVYQAYGHADILHEAVLSVASALKLQSIEHDFIVVIYTDAPDYFKQFLPSSVQYIIVPPKKWEEWKGNQQFVHRAKIMMLLDAVERFEGDFLYCDTDTYFLSSPSSLFYSIEKGDLVMHVDEGSLHNSKNKVFQKLEKFLIAHARFAIPVDMHMWNAGVLGFKSSDSSLLREVLKLSDELYQAYPKHVMEQLAFSFHFGLRNRVACGNQVFHYWDFKEYRSVLRSFFEKHKGESYEVWVRDVDRILPMELIKKKQAYFKRSYLLRKIDKLLGKQVSYL